MKETLSSWPGCTDCLWEAVWLSGLVISKCQLHHCSSTAQGVDKCSLCYLSSSSRSHCEDRHVRLQLLMPSSHQKHSLWLQEWKLLDKHPDSNICFACSLEPVPYLQPHPLTGIMMFYCELTCRLHSRMLRQSISEISDWMADKNYWWSYYNTW